MRVPSVKILKILVGALGVVIIVLILALIFATPAKAPQPGNGTGGSVTATSTISPDGHVAVILPRPGDIVASPVSAQGTVTDGGWFFEATFPVKVLDANGNVLGAGQATAEPPEAWMTTGTVPWSASVTFSKPTTATGIIVFAKDNPSGNPANAMEFSVPVNFGAAGGASGANGTSGVTGKVVLGPTCPVERIPPDPACAPRPYQTSIAIARQTNPSVTYKTIATDASGTFSANLPPGEYVFTPKSGNPFPRCTASSITVPSNGYATTTLQCDTGIR